MRFWFVLVTLVAVASTTTASAQLADPFGTGEDAPAEQGVIEWPETLTPQVIDSLVARLSDDEVRDALIDVLQAQAEAAAAQEEQAGMTGLAFAIQTRAAEMAMQLGFIFWVVEEDLPNQLPRAVDRLAEGRGAGYLLLLVAEFLAVVAVGWTAWWLVRRAVTVQRRRLEVTPPAGYWDKVWRLVLRTAFDLLALAAFTIVTFGLFIVLVPRDSPFAMIATSYVLAIVLPWATSIVARMVLAPGAARIRIAPIGDDGARYLHRWIVRLVVVASIGWFFSSLFVITGLGFELYFLTVAITGMIVAAMMVVAIWKGRRPVAAAICPPEQRAGGGTMRVRAAFAGSWHVFAIVYVVGVWLIWVSDLLARGERNIDAAIASIVVIGLLPIIDRMCGNLLAIFFRPQRQQEGQGAAPSDAEQTTDAPDAASADEAGPSTDEAATPAIFENPYFQILDRAVRLIVFIGAAVVVLRLWSFDVFAYTHGPDADPIAAGLFQAAATILVAWFVWSVIRAALAAQMPKTPQPHEGTDPDARARTLVPLFRKTLGVVVVIVVGMIVLSSLGVDIAPLLASAGVVGLAIGFGAQALVRDIVSGIFFLIDDAFRVGEYIEMGEIRGTVEAISIRSLRLRHHRGAIHTVPFGEIRSITNYMRDWTIYKMEFRVNFDADIDMIKRIVKQIGKEMWVDPELGPKMLDVLKSQGVTRIDDSALIVRCKFTCKPGEQFILRREAYKRITKAFMENGIELASRNVMVRVPGAPPAAKERPEELAAAASSALATDAAAS